MPPEFQYDVFVSYSSKDGDWARKLTDDLTAKGLDVFRDQDRLEPGFEWRGQLDSALDASRHLVVVWTGNAKESEWVHKEIARFDAALTSSDRSAAIGRRRVLLLLQGESSVYSHLQAVPDLKEAGLYPDGKPEGEQWDRAVAKLAKKLEYDEGALSIPVLLFTMTDSQVHELDVKRSRLDGIALETLLDALNIEGTAALAARYGESRRAWRPFGLDTSVDLILDKLQDDVNGQIRRAPARNGALGDVARVKWEYVDDDFWASAADAKRMAQALAADPAVIVVDPLALYHDRVYEFHTVYGAKVLENRDAFVLVLTPFPAPDVSVVLRDALKSVATQLYEHYYEPLSVGTVGARCGPNVGDELELGAWLASAVGPRFARGPQGNEFTSNSTQ